MKEIKRLRRWMLTYSGEGTGSEPATLSRAPLLTMPVCVIAWKAVRIEGMITSIASKQ
jgi:hypothetical protein